MAKKRRQATDEDVEDANEKSGGEKDLYEVRAVRGASLLPSDFSEAFGISLCLVSDWLSTFWWIF